MPHDTSLGIASIAVLVCLVSGGSARAGGVAILDTVLSDNGDNDGFADTRETVQVRLLVRNTSGAALDGLTLGLSSVGPAAPA
jgi:hypothetical protein